MTQELIDFLLAISVAVVLAITPFVFLKIADKDEGDDPLFFLFLAEICVIGAVGTIVVAVILF